MDVKKIKWIFFDMGSTLLNEDYEHQDRARVIVEEINKSRETKVTLEEFEEKMKEYGAEGKHFIYEAARYYGIKEVPKYRPGCEVLYEGVRELLDALSSRYKLGIIASQPGGSIKRLQAHGILKYFDMCFSSSEIGLDKPDPEFFRAALEAVKCPPENAAMVGDRTDNDIIPANTVGMFTVKVHQSYRAAYLPKSKYSAPDAEVDNIAAVADIFLTN